MSEYVEREAEDRQPHVDQWAEEHITFPPELLSNQARQFYDSLREANKWLPNPDHVSTGRDLELTFGVDSIATLTLTCFVVIPEGLI